MTSRKDITKCSEAAAHESVTEHRLTERKFGVLMGYLYTQPLIEYLTDGEQPQFILDNGGSFSFSGPDIPSKPETTAAGTVKHLVTDRRWLVVAGNKNGDETLSVPLQDITGLSVGTDLLSHDVSFTTERFRLDAPIAKTHESDVIQSLRDWLIANTAATGTGLQRFVSDEGPATVAQPDVSERIDNALHDSVTEQRLTELEFGLLAGKLYTKPLIDYLGEDEQPHFLFSPGLSDGTIDLVGSSAPTPPNQAGTNTTMHLITERRWLVVAGNENGDETLSVPLQDITGLAVQTEPWTNTVSFTTDRFRFEAPIKIDAEDLDRLHRWLIVNTGVDGTGLKPVDQPEKATAGADPDGITALIDAATHSSVTEPRLTKLKTGHLTQDFYTKPLIDYLREDEQPHFILDTDMTNISLEGAYAPRVPERNATGTVRHLITEQRWLVIAGNKNGDQTLTVSLSAINGVEREDRTIEVTTDQFLLKAPIAIHAENELRSIERFLVANTAADGTGLKEIEHSLEVHMDAEPQGSWVTESRITKLGNVLEAGETVHYMFRGSSLDIEGDGPEDESSLTGVFTAITDKRIAVNVSQFLGDDERYIPYSSIISCNLDTGMTVRYVTIVTRGPTYRIDVSQPSDSELREALQFVQNKATAARDAANETSRSAQDPTEQLKNIKELHDEGVLTDEEFNEKKRQLLDRI
ncbi:PH domain-containing protein [Halocatena pleomorpha]|nr:PH domain-containing protein [Halocatena pleomorpha]